MKRRSNPTFSLDDLRKSPVAHLNPHLFQTQNKPKAKSKYGNQKQEVDGILFDSAREAKRYKELMLLLKAGVIGLLRRQVPYELNEGGSHSLKYIADFVYVESETGETVVEDSKGFRTREYIKKRKLMLKIHNIKIKEV